MTSEERKIETWKHGRIKGSSDPDELECFTKERLISLEVCGRIGGR